MFVALHEFGHGTTAKCVNVCFRAAVDVIADVTQTSSEDSC